MGGKYTVDAQLLTQSFNSFTGKDKEQVEYYEMKFLMESEDGTSEVITLRSKNQAHKETPKYKDSVTGILSYEWRYNEYNKGWKPAFISFE